MLDYVQESLSVCRGGFIALYIPQYAYMFVSGMGFVTGEVYLRWICISYYLHSFVNWLLKLEFQEKGPQDCRTGYETPSLESQLVASLFFYAIFTLFVSLSFKRFFYCLISLSMYLLEVSLLYFTGNASLYSIVLGSLLGLFLSLFFFGLVNQFLIMDTFLLKYYSVLGGFVGLENEILVQRKRKNVPIKH